MNRFSSTPRVEGGAAVLLYLENVAENLRDPARAVKTKVLWPWRKKGKGKARW